MKARILILMSVVLLVSAGVQAADVTWTGAADDQDWNNSQNWDTGTVPVAEDIVHLNGLPGPIVTDDVTVDELYIGRNEPGALTVLSGNFRCSKRLYMAASSGEARLDLHGGVFNSNGGAAGGWQGIGDGGKTTINIFAGEFKSNNATMNTDATVNMYGGRWNSWGLVTNEGSLLNIQGGSFRAGRNGQADPDSMQAKVDDGTVQGYNGTGDVVITPDGGTFSLVTATHELSPVPTDANTVYATEIDLMWAVPAWGNDVDVYFTDDFDKLVNFYPEDIEEMLIVDRESVSSVPVTVEKKKRYFWAVDVYAAGASADAEPNYGPIFHFDVDNKAPEVVVGAGIIAYLEDGSVTGQISGTATDAGELSILWVIDSQPDEPNNPAVIADPTSEVTDITLTAVGTYELRLTANDGEYDGEDAMTITVTETSCEAAKALPGYEPIAGDLNGDCVVNDEDQAIMTENWLKDNSLDMNWQPVE